MKLRPIEYNNQRILTTEQLAEVYSCDPVHIRQNLNNNRSRFIEGKHYYLLQGDELTAFKNQVDNIDAVGKRAARLYLWTQRGANRHCKILDTDKAWDQFEALEETYFRVKEQKSFQTPHTAAKYLSGLASYLRIQRTIMLDRGCTPLEIAEMSKCACDFCGVPVPDAIVARNHFEQQLLDQPDTLRLPV